MASARPTTILVRALREHRLSTGHCVRCGNLPVAKGRKSCLPCLRLMAEDVAERRARVACGAAGGA